MKKKQHPLTKTWTNILESAISNNKDLRDDLERLSACFIESNLEKLKGGNDLERKVYEQYTKNKKLTPKVLKQHYAAILSELILTTEHEVNLTLLNYVFEQKLAKTVVNEMSIAFALISCLFSFCQGPIEGCGKEKFMKIIADALDWHIDAHKVRKDDPDYQKVAEEATRKLLDEYDGKTVQDFKEALPHLMSTLTGVTAPIKTKKEDLN